MKNLNLFIELTRLKNPIGYMLLFWPCIWGLTIAYNFNNDESIHIIFGDLNSNKKSLDIKNIKNLDAICILIGPEGDFTPDERDKILNHKKIYPLKINNNILRSETAAISMISIVNFNFLS